ncbi:hypothetical protein [Tropicibacter sp. Alg240-R139]|uniref:hypothetical protein n=1 Tax=Tropicibacter sp. Alg240-R139 TaxID=2305991 RepID=UPI0013E01B31|nr:hypothetical protein [Tropicibacter sp. Alg240-R139]
MFLELIATVFAGFAAAGVMMLVGRWIPGLPRWLTPVVAGAAMIAATIASEYGWYERTRASLPVEFMVIETVESRAIYRPWTYVVPFVERFAAVDTASVQTHGARPDQRLADLYLLGRWAPVSKLPVAVDCAGSRRANLADGVEFDADGAINGASWVSVAPDDSVVLAICGVS